MATLIAADFMDSALLAGEGPVGKSASVSMKTN